jgi:predicted 2-oxoglutarate/Fe(II)-dependent dioxygenase YbiX
MLHDYYFFKNLYTHEECCEIYENALLNRDGNLFDSPAPNKNLTSFAFYNANLKKELYKFFRDVYFANRQAFGFDLYPVSEIKTSAINIYDTGRSYACHRDASKKGCPSDIKLTAILNISPEAYTGGEFILHFGQNKQPMKDIRNTGDLLVFPSFIYHEVEPVTSGRRITLTSWISGPNWK